MKEDQVKKAEELLAILKTKKAHEQDAIKLIEKGFALTQINKDLKAQFFESKFLFLFRNAKNKEGLACCEEFEQFINKNPQLLYYTARNERYRMLFQYGVGEKTKAVYTGDRIIQKLENNHTEKIEKTTSDIYWITGGLATNIGDYDKCTRYLNKALVLAKKHHQNDVEGSIYAALGDIYQSNNEFENAIKYLTLGIAHTKSPTPTNITCSMLCGLGKIYLVQHKNMEAMQCFEESLEINKTLNHPRTQVLTLLGMAEHNIKNKNASEFGHLKIELEKLPYFKKDQEMQMDLLFLESEALLIKEELTLALKCANEYEAYCEKQTSILSLKKLYELKIRIYTALKSFKLSVEHYKKLIEVNEKILNEKNKKHLQAFEQKFQNERKEKEIQALKLESVSFQLQSLRAQINPHFVFNTIASISQDLHPETISKSQNLLESFARLMRANLDFAEEEKITLEDEIKFLTDYLLLEQNRLGDKLSFSIDYDKELDLDFIEIPSMLIQPYIENAVKHGIMPLEDEGEINITFQENEDQIICTIEDNGIGRKAAEIRKIQSSAHLGKSTTINAKRLALLSPKLKDNLKVIYTDKENDARRAMGTIVQITIKA